MTTRGLGLDNDHQRAAAPSTAGFHANKAQKQITTYNICGDDKLLIYLILILRAVFYFYVNIYYYFCFFCVLLSNQSINQSIIYLSACHYVTLSVCLSDCPPIQLLICSRHLSSCFLLSVVPHDCPLFQNFPLSWFPSPSPFSGSLSWFSLPPHLQCCSIFATFL